MLDLDPVFELHEIGLAFQRADLEGGNVPAGFRSRVCENQGLLRAWDWGGSIGMACSGDPQATQGDGQAPHHPVQPGLTSHLHELPVPQDLDHLSPDSLLLAACKEHAKGSVGIEDVVGRNDSNGHRDSKLFCDLLKTRRRIEGARLGLLNTESGRHSLGEDVDDGVEPVRSIVVAQSASQPEAAVGTADSGTLGVDSAAALGPLMDAGRASELAQLVDPKDAAAE